MARILPEPCQTDLVIWRRWATGNDGLVSAGIPARRRDVCCRLANFVANIAKISHIGRPPPVGVLRNKGESRPRNVAFSIILTLPIDGSVSVKACCQKFDPKTV